MRSIFKNFVNSTPTAMSKTATVNRNVQMVVALKSILVKYASAGDKVLGGTFPAEQRTHTQSSYNRNTVSNIHSILL